MKIKPRPELSGKYPAIDGIKKEHKGFERDVDRYTTLQQEQESIRSDIIEILNLDNHNFDEWYHIRKSTIEKLLNDYNLVASVPDLRFASEEQKSGLNSYHGLREMIDVLNRGLEYLDIIKKVRNESKE